MNETAWRRTLSSHVAKMSIEKTILIGTVPYVREDIFKKNPGKYTLKPGEQLEAIEASSIIVEKKQTDTGTNDLQLMKNSGIKLPNAPSNIVAPKYNRVSQQVIPASSTDKGVSLPPEELTGHESLVAQLADNAQKE